MTNNNQAIDRSRPAPGSIKDVATRTNRSIEEVFMDLQALVMVDVSSSMDYAEYSPDGTRGKSRWERANEELLNIQAQYPGLIGVIAFGATTDFIYDGHIPDPSGSTPMHDALDLAIIADGGLEMWLISDGEPDNGPEVLKRAAKFASRINTIFVGSKGDYGENFLIEVSKATGGVSSTSVDFKEGTLAKVTLLLSPPQGAIAL